MTPIFYLQTLYVSTEVPNKSSSDIISVKLVKYTRTRQIYGILNRDRLSSNVRGT